MNERRKVHPAALNIKTLRALGHRLGLSPELLLSSSHEAGRSYKPYTSPPKCRPFPKKPTVAKERRIDRPVGTAKDIQRRINRHLLKPLFLPPHIFGGVRGKSILDNANHHLGARLLVTLDIRNFFPSITTFQIYRIWSDVLGCSPEVSGLLTRLTTFERHLPLGAPTSTALANLVLYSVDRMLRDQAKATGVRYSTWVDDMALSGDGSRNLINVAAKSLSAGGFSLSRRKLKIMNASNRRLLTGTLLNDSVGISKEYVSQTRSGIHKLATGCVSCDDVYAYVRSLVGRIAHIRRLNSRRAEILENQLRAVLIERKADHLVMKLLSPPLP